MVANFHVQDWADSRIFFENPSSYTSFLFVSRHRVFSAKMLHLLFFVEKYCPLSTSFEPASGHNLDIFCFRTIVRIFARILAPSFTAAVHWYEFLHFKKASVSKWSGASGFSAAPKPSDSSLHRSAMVLQTLSSFAEITVRRSNSMFSSLPLKWKDFWPCPLLLNSPLSKALEARNIGWPDYEKFDIMFSAVWSQDPSGLSL